MAEQKFPITYFGKVIGTATLEEGGEIHGEIDGDILTPDERRRILGHYPQMSFSVEEHLAESLSPREIARLGRAEAAEEIGTQDMGERPW